MSLDLVVLVLSVVLGFVAAGCWFRAGTVKVSPAQANAMREAHMAKHGRTGYAAWTLFDGSDMEFTLAVQSKWNRYGALAAGGAALCQAIYILITTF